LDDREILTLARWGVAIEAHYQRPMDIEWAKDGRSGELYVVQARPETVEGRKARGTLKTYTLHDESDVLVTGLAIGQSIAVGPVRGVRTPEDAANFPARAVLVTEMTNPDWVPIMRRAAAIVTDH